MLGTRIPSRQAKCYYDKAEISALLMYVIMFRQGEKQAFRDKATANHFTRNAFADFFEESRYRYIEHLDGVRPRITRQVDCHRVLVYVRQMQFLGDLSIASVNSLFFDFFNMLKGYAMIVCLSVRHNVLNTVPLKPLACFLQFADTVPLFTLLS